MAEPRVTIIVPTFDRPRLLHRALASVATQEGLEPGAIEVVVVHDGGAVDPAPVLEHVRGAAPGVELHLERHALNAGRSASRNTGLARARAKRVLFLDDDDLLHPTHVATLLDAVQGEAHVPYTGAEQVLEDADGLVHGRTVHDDGGAFSERILRLRNLFPIHAALVPIEQVRAIGGFDTSLEVLEDWDLWLRLLPRVSYERIDAVTCEFRHRAGSDNSVTRERAHHIEAIARVYERHPLPDTAEREALLTLRERIVADSTRALEASWTYDRSVLVELDPAATAESVHAALGALIDAQDAAGGSWEAVIAAPRTEQVEAALAGVEGDLVVVWHDAGDAAPARPELLRALERRATGRTIVPPATGG